MEKLRIFNLLFYPSYTASSWLRAGVPCSLFERLHGCEVITADPQTLTPELAVQGLNADVYLINREVPCLIGDLMIRKARAEGRRVVCELDDLILDPPPAHPHCFLYSQYRSGYERLLAGADLVVASSDALAEHLRKFNPEVHVFHHLFQPTRAPGPLRTNGPVVVGYSGLAAHSGELEFLVDVFSRVRERAGEKIVFKVIGCTHPALEQSGLPVEFIPGTPDYRRYRDILAAAKFDIGLGYLQQNEFNLCKSNIRFHEYAEQGIIGLYSDFGPYRTIRTRIEGYLLDNTVESWADRIVRTAQDLKGHEEMRSRAFQRTQRDYQESRAAEYYNMVSACRPESGRGDFSHLPGRVAIYGAGSMGRYCAILLRALGCAVECFIDRAGGGANAVDGIPVLPPDHLRRIPSIPVLIASYSHFNEIHDILSRTFHRSFQRGLV